MHLKSKLSKELKKGIEILVGQTVFKVRIKNSEMLFWSITQEPLDLPEFWYFWVPWKIYYKMCMLFFQKSVDD